MSKKNSFSKVVGAAGIGNVLEYYDFTLFVFLTPTISPLFFPTGDSLTSIIAGLGVYALGYFVRPVGAIYFGYLGDTYGRKRALTLSILMMAFPTVLIGCLPTYESIGILSPLLLTFFRLLQGLCTGGEYNGAAIFTVENVPQHKRTFGGSIISSSSSLGSLLGSLVAALVSLPFMPTWGWRCAFLAGALVALVGLYIRLKVEEVHTLAPVRARTPLVEAIKGYPLAMFCGLCVAAFSGIQYNLSLSYVSIYLNTIKKWPLSESLIVMSFGFALYIILVPIVGRIGERIGERKTMVCGILATLIGIYPAVYMLTQAESIFSAILAVSCLVVFCALYQAPMNSYIARFFPPACRYTGVALSYSVGMAIFGGTTSMIIALLIKWTGDPMSSVVYVVFGALLGLIGVLKAKPRFAEIVGEDIESSEKSRAVLSA